MTTHWHCTRCNATYRTPKPALAVTCAKCTKRNGGKQQWMRPEEPPPECSPPPPS